MPLSRHLEQGRLLYFSPKPDAISVSENDQLRWLAFDDIVQSLVRKNKPEQLTLPHQWALMMPLLSCTPTTITELGLGAGNHLMFTQSLGRNIKHQVIEANNKVIELALKYFPLSHYALNILHQDANSWFEQETITSANRHSDWIIFDIYQKNKFGDRSYNELLSKVITWLPSGAILSINFPESTEKEVKYWLTRLANKIQHNIHYYTVPHFKNQVIHLMPKQASESIRKNSALSLRQQRYWRCYQLRFGLTTG